MGGWRVSGWVAGKKLVVLLNESAEDLLRCPRLGTNELKSTHTHTHTHVTQNNNNNNNNNNYDNNKVVIVMKEKYIIDEDVRLGALPCCRYLVAVLLLFFCFCLLICLLIC